MGRYYLKIKLTDGVELNFDTQDKNLVRLQLDEYFDYIVHGKKTSSDTADSFKAETKEIVSTDSMPRELKKEIWEEEQSEIVDKFIEKPVSPDTPDGFIIPDTPVAFEVPEAAKPQDEELQVSTEVLSKYIKDKAKDLFGALIATAFFIKNDLKLESFSIKFLNSKLYEASGKLIDHTIIGEGLNKGFLNIVEEPNGPIQYTINSLGEDYFSKM